MPRDILLGLGIEIPLLGSQRIGVKGALMGSILGGALSYLPYILPMAFMPIQPFSFLSAYAGLLLLMSGKLLSSALGDGQPSELSK